MYFPTRGPAAAALMAALASASPVDLVQRSPLLGLGAAASASASGNGVSASISLDVSLQEELLVAGVVADVAVAPIVGAAAAAEVIVACRNCYVHGSVDASLSLAHVLPSLSLSLTDIEAYLDLDIKIGVATTIAVNLFTPDELLQLSLPGLDVSAKVFLDLVLAVESSIDLSAGVYVELVDEAHINTDLLAGTILDAAFSGLSVATLPVTVRIGCTTLQADLRLRVQAAVSLDLEVDEILPILDIIPDIDAGVNVAIYANLLEYVGLFCDNTPSCPLSEESYGLNIGAAVGLNVEVEDIATLRLAPTISTTFLTVPTSTLCDLVSRPPGGGNFPGGPGFPVVTPTDGVLFPTGTPSIELPHFPAGNGGSPGYPGNTPGYPGKPPAYSAKPTAAATLPVAGPGEVTSVVSVPQTYIITACAVPVANCPAELQEEKTVVTTVVYTTVCPATATITDLPKPSGSINVSAPKASVSLSSTSCVETFTSPPGYPVAARGYATETASVPAPSATESYSASSQPVTETPAPSSSVSQPPYPTSVVPSTGASNGTTSIPPQTETTVQPTGSYPTNTPPSAPPSLNAGAGPNAIQGLAILAAVGAFFL